MFIRYRQVKGRRYAEATESYRDADGKPKHRVHARWWASATLAQEIAWCKKRLADKRESLARHEGYLDGTVEPRRWQDVRYAPLWIENYRKSIARWEKQLAACQAVAKAHPELRHRLDKMGVRTPAEM